MGRSVLRWARHARPSTLRGLRRRALGAALFLVTRDRGGNSPSLNGGEKVFILIADGYGMGGTTHTVFNTAEWLARRHQVDIVSAIRSRDEPFFPLPAGVRIIDLDDRREGHRSPGARGWLRMRLSRMPSLLSDRQAGTPSWNLWTDVVVLLWLRSLKDCVLITTRPRFNVLAGRVASRRNFLIGQEHLHAAAYDERMQSVVQREYAHLDALTVLTRQDRDAYAATLGSTHVRIVQIPNTVGIRYPTFAAGPRRPTIVAAGRLVDVKGFDLLVDAWSRIESAWPQWRVEIYGRGPRRRSLEALIARRGLVGRVELMGATRDLEMILDSAGLFVLPSRSEGFAMVLIEAMASGCPVISFDCPRGPREIVRDGVDGILVADGDVEQLAAAMQQMLRDRPLRERYSAAGIDRARAYSIETVGPRWDSLLSSSTRSNFDPGAGEPVGV